MPKINEGGNMNRVTVSEAAKILGVSAQFIRIGLQRGRLPIGSAVRMSSKWTYHISPERLRKYIEGDQQDEATMQRV